MVDELDCSPALDGLVLEPELAKTIFFDFFETCFFAAEEDVSLLDLFLDLRCERDLRYACILRQPAHVLWCQFRRTV